MTNSVYEQSLEDIANERISYTGTPRPQSAQSSSQQPTITEDSLVLWERVTATFLFLRFIVPAITAPESFGLCRDRKITTQTRRGLIACGKILNGFCSEMDYRDKDPNMPNAHLFIEQRRPEIRDYVNYLARRPDSQIFHQQQSSEDYAVSVKVDHRLPIYLAQSIGRLEKDIGQLVECLPPVDTGRVGELFVELRQALEPIIDALQREQEQPKLATAQSQSSSSSRFLLSRVHEIFGSMGLAALKSHQQS